MRIDASTRPNEEELTHTYEEWTDELIESGFIFPPGTLPAWRMTPLNADPRLMISSDEVEGRMEHYFGDDAPRYMWRLGVLAGSAAQGRRGKHNLDAYRRALSKVYTDEELELMKTPGVTRLVAASNANPEYEKYMPIEQAALTGRATPKGTHELFDIGYDAIEAAKASFDENAAIAGRLAVREAIEFFGGVWVHDVIDKPVTATASITKSGRTVLGMTDPDGEPLAATWLRGRKYRGTTGENLHAREHISILLDLQDEAYQARAEEHGGLTKGGSIKPAYAIADVSRELRQPDGTPAPDYLKYATDTIWWFRKELPQNQSSSLTPLERDI